MNRNHDDYPGIGSILILIALLGIAALGIVAVVYHLITGEQLW